MQITAQTWLEIKTFMINHNVQLMYYERTNKYHLCAITQLVTVCYEMDKNPQDPTDLNDFENNYKSGATKIF